MSARPGGQKAAFLERGGNGSLFVPRVHLELDIRQPGRAYDVNVENLRV